MLVTVDEIKSYLRVDYPDDDALLDTLIASAEKQCFDISRAESKEVFYTMDNAKLSVMFTTAYLYEHREDANHRELNLTLRALLFGDRKDAF